MSDWRNVSLHWQWLNKTLSGRVISTLKVSKENFLIKVSGDDFQTTFPIIIITVRKIQMPMEFLHKKDQIQRQQQRHSVTFQSKSKHETEFLLWQRKYRVPFNVDHGRMGPMLQLSRRKLSKLDWFHQWPVHHPFFWKHHWKRNFCL